MVLPGVLPGVFGGLSVGIGVAWICVISAEMISGRLGVGYRTWQAYTVLAYPEVFVGIITIGVLGFLMRRFDFPIAPVVVGLILGPIAESQLRRALQISLGDPMTLLQSPISATLLAVALIALVAPFVLKGLGRFKASED